MATIFGSVHPFDAATIQRLYPGGAQDFLDRFTAALDASIAVGFILMADRAEILAIVAADLPAVIQPKN
jgi:hypothetical protein